MTQKLDPKTGKWTRTKTDTKGKEKTNKDTTDKGGVKDSSSSKDTATSKATQKVNKKTIRTLVGNLSMVPNENSIKVIPRSTIKLNGLAKYISIESIKSSSNGVFTGLSFKLKIHLFNCGIEYFLSYQLCNDYRICQLSIFVEKCHIGNI